MTVHTINLNNYKLYADIIDMQTDFGNEVKSARKEGKTVLCTFGPEMLNKMGRQAYKDRNIENVTLDHVAGTSLFAQFADVLIFEDGSKSKQLKNRWDCHS